MNNKTADEAIAEAKVRREEAARKHPAAANPDQPPPLALDEDDKPTYSVKQVERLVKAATETAGNPAATTAATTAATIPSSSLQTSSLSALMRELDRRRKEAQTKLAGIPTELLELELQRRKEDNVD